MEWFFELALNRRTNSFSVAPKATWDADTDLDFRPTSFSSKREALLKILEAWISWSKRSWCSHWIWGGQAGTSTLARNTAAVTWRSCAAFGQCSCAETYVPRETDLKNYYNPQSDIIHVSQNCLWFVHSLEARELCCIGFTGIELICHRRKKFYCLFWVTNTKSLKD